MLLCVAHDYNVLQLLCVEAHHYTVLQCGVACTGIRMFEYSRLCFSLGACFVHAWSMRTAISPDFLYLLK